MKTVRETEFPSEAYIDSPAVIGAAVRASRTQAGLRMADAAALLGVAIQTLADVEAGRPSVSIGKVLTITHGLGVNLFAVPPGMRETVRRTLADLQKAHQTP